LSANEKKVVLTACQNQFATVKVVGVTGNFELEVAERCFGVDRRNKFHGEIAQFVGDFVFLIGSKINKMAKKRENFLFSS
jgi:hypothetical protein